MIRADHVLLRGDCEVHGVSETASEKLRVYLRSLPECLRLAELLNPAADVGFASENQRRHLGGELNVVNWNSIGRLSGKSSVDSFHGKHSTGGLVHVFVLRSPAIWSRL